MSLAAVIFRGIILNLVVWLPIAVLVFCVLRILAERIGEVADGWLQVLAECLGGDVGGHLAALAVVGVTFLVVSVLYSLITWRPILSQPY